VGEQEAALVSYERALDLARSPCGNPMLPRGVAMRQVNAVLSSGVVAGARVRQPSDVGRGHHRHRNDNILSLQTLRTPSR